MMMLILVTWLHVQNAGVEHLMEYTPALFNIRLLARPFAEPLSEILARAGRFRHLSPA